MRRRRISFVTAALAAVITFVSLTAFVGNRYHLTRGWHHHRHFDCDRYDDQEYHHDRRHQDSAHYEQHSTDSLQQKQY